VTSVDRLCFGSRCFYEVKILLTMRFKFYPLVLPPESELEGVLRCGVEFIAFGLGAFFSSSVRARPDLSFHSRR
jgi:hypothetical protein